MARTATDEASQKLVRRLDETLGTVSGMLNSRNDLLASIDHALERSRDSSKLVAWQENAAERLTGLTLRQCEIMELILAGHPNKIIAADLGISQRTVESHRAQIMNKTGSKSLQELARLALAAAFNAD